jgi:hypothetical protein
MNDLKKRVEEEKARSPFSGSPGNANAGFSPFGKPAGSSTVKQPTSFSGTGINGIGPTGVGNTQQQLSQPGAQLPFRRPGAQQDVQLSGNPQIDWQRSDERSRRLEQARREGIEEARQEEEERRAVEQARMEEARRQGEQQARIQEAARMSEEKRSQAISNAISTSDDK